MAQQTGSRRVVVFLAIATVLSAVVSVLDDRGVFGHAGSLAYMWCPGVAALLASLFTGRSLKAIGWRPRPKWMLLGWAIPIAYATVAYGLVWLTGLGGVPRDRFLVRGSQTMGMVGKPAWEVIVAAIGFIMVLSVLPSLISALGEEIGWRGFLVPELNGWIGPRGAAAVSGIVWALWHLPAIFHGYGTEGTPRAYQIACFFGMVLLSAVMMTWLRLRSGSIWPTALVHASHNAAIQMFFDAITAPRAHTAWFIGEFGCAMLLPLAVVAWWCWRELGESKARETAGALAASAAGA